MLKISTLRLVNSIFKNKEEKFISRPLNQSQKTRTFFWRKRSQKKKDRSVQVQDSSASLVWVTLRYVTRLVTRLAIFVKKVARNHELPSIGSGKVAKESRERSRYDLARLEPARHVTRALISSDGRDTSLSTDFSTNSLLDYSLKIVVKEKYQ